MKKEHITMQSFYEQLKSMPYDPFLNAYKEDLLKEMTPCDILIFPNQFFYITDFSEAQNQYIHPNAEKVLGFPPDKFRKFRYIYDLIHPDDREFLMAFSFKTLAFSHQMKEKLIKNPFCAVFSIDFRIKRADGKEIRLNQQTSCYKLDHEGNLAYQLSLFTDISHLKKTICITYSWAGEGLEDFNIDDILPLNKNIAFSEREIEILDALSYGMEGPEIAKHLCISEHTVISHRKNMLRKTGARNSTELIRIAFESGILSHHP